MGKRELLLIVAFAVAGAVVYQLAAPPSRPGQPGFSFSQMFSAMRQGMRGNPASVTISRTDTMTLAESVTELRVSGVSGRLEIQGESRADIAYDLQIESNGPDDATAKRWADLVVMKRDDLGSSLTLRLNYPKEGRQRAVLTLHVPARLAVRVDGSNVAVSHVDAVHFEGVLGDTSVHDVAHEVTGTHRNGELKIADAGSASLTLISSRATLTNIRGAVTLNARNGACALDAPAGAVEIDETNNEITVRHPAATTRITGSSGRITIERPRAEVRVDARRAEVELLLDAAVPATALTTDDTLRLLLDGPPSVVVDATATDGGTVQARDFNLDAPAGEGEQRLMHAFGAAGGARVALRNQHGEIVIRKAK